MKTNTYVNKLFLVAAMLLQAAAISAQDYFEPISTEGVSLKGTITAAVLNKVSVMEEGLYEFPYENKFEPVPDNKLLPVYAPGGAVYHNGKIYCNVFDDTNNIAEQTPHWTIYDAKTYELLKDVELKDNCENTTKTLAYDPTTDKIYGIVQTYTEYFIVSVDPETGRMEQVGDKMDYEKQFVSIACNKKGVLYCIYIKEGQPYLAKIRKSDGKIATIGAVTPQNLLPNDKMVNFAYDQSLFFNNATGKLYWIFASSSIYLEMEYTVIMEVDTKLATATLKSYIPKSYHVSGAFLDEPEVTAPSIISDFKFEPSDEGSVEGVLKMKLPETDYAGNKLNGKVTAYISEDDEDIAIVEGIPGSEITTENIKFTNDNHKVAIYVTNEAGEVGPTIYRSFFAGWDIPGACQNIKLTADGLKTTLTWDPPVEGIHGAAINPESYTYKIIRYPNEVIVANYFDGRVFEEEHPSDMTRYVYIVIPVNGNYKEGKPAFSNNLIVGTPLDVPFGGSFKDPADLFNYYTIYDSNRDGYSWSYDLERNYAVYRYNWEQDADDWMLTPPINYKKGKTYILTFKAFSSDKDYPEAMEVKWGKTRNPENYEKSLLFIPEVPIVKDGIEPEYTTEITAEDDDIYYFGFHVFTPAYSGNLYLYDISICQKEDTAIDGVTTSDDGIHITTDRGVVNISNPAEDNVIIYTSCGEVIAESNQSMINKQLKSGIYLVKAGDEVHKIIIF